mmetsp:Transcript_10802/g.32524  ORF Transcript_10802/g.32524 Transcript_10802/m.32524 type:complete len:162 (-) Transcript_10802:86-571(-)
MASPASSRAASSKATTPSFVRRAASTGAPRSKWYRDVPATVPREEMQTLDQARRAYDARFMTTTLQDQHRHVGEHIEQVRRTHAEKQAYFTQHSAPNLTWMDLNGMTQERSMAQKQPAYFADVGSQPRMGVMARRLHTPLGNRVSRPALSLSSKSGMMFGF